jgi:predicted transcriptional regulator YdeE
MAPSTAKIPGLWGRFLDESIAEEIPNKKPGGTVIGAYTKYESDHAGPYSLIVGLEVSSLESIPGGMTGLVIPRGHYLVFTAQGSMPTALIDTWTSIWNYFPQESSHKRLYTADYEVHRSNERVDVYVAVT